MDPIGDKYIFDVGIPRSHELKYKKVHRPLLYRKLASFPICSYFLDLIGGFTREPNGSEPHGYRLWSQTVTDRLEPVCRVSLSVPAQASNLDWLTKESPAKGFYQ